MSESQPETPAQDVPAPAEAPTTPADTSASAPVTVVPPPPEPPVAVPQPEADPHLAPVETSQPDWNLSDEPAETLQPEVTHVTASTDEGQQILHAAALGIVSAAQPDLDGEALGEAVQRYIDMNANTLLPALRATLASKGA